MAYRKSPIPAINGGTGRVTLTSNNILVGNGTSAVTLLAPSASQFLVSNASSVPAFANSVTGDLTLSNATNGTSRAFGVVNTSTTSGNAVISRSVAAASSGDCYDLYTVTSGSSWTQGPKNSDSDSWSLSASGTLGTTNVLRASTGGSITIPLQPMFLAYPSATVNSVTGEGTAYTIALNTALINQRTCFNTSTFTYTCPSDVPSGAHLHMFSFGVTMTGVTAANNLSITVFTTQRQIVGALQLMGAAQTGGTFNYVGTVMADISASETCFFQITSQGSVSKVINVIGGANPLYTFFSGYLIG